MILVLFFVILKNINHAYERLEVDLIVVVVAVRNVFANIIPQRVFFYFWNRRNVVGRHIAFFRLIQRNEFFENFLYVLLLY